MTWWQDDIRDTADALTEPTIHREPIHEWDHHRHKKTRHHQTVQPGLLQQLYRAVIPTTAPADDTPTGSVPASRPPLAIEALSVHTEISTAVRNWNTALGLQQRPGVESNLRQIAAKAMSFDEVAARDLLTELRRWRRWCLVMTGWEKVRRLRGVDCPHLECGRRESLRVNLTTVSAMCVACGSVWSKEDGTIGLLIEHANTEKTK